MNITVKTLTCQEAALDSGDTYRPCGQPAERSIFRARDGRAYNMCSPCADHNVRNRGGQDQGPASSENPDIPIQEAVYDYGQYAEQPSAEGDLSTLSNLAEQARVAEQDVEDLQRRLKAAQDQHRQLVETQIPELMEKCGVQKFSTRNGLNIEVKENIRASLGSGDEKERNFDWLEQNGHEAIIKLAVTVPFGRGEAERDSARALAKRLQGDGIDAEFERKVEPSTLSSLIRELLEDGKPVPEGQFHVFRQRIAKIK